ncbi:vacuolar sorting-associated 13D isoform X2 [Brachionus plicatilis]|uniref:Vacuolar sorting-associated 13D isoform X2 n=1 Tax=Brachionus plicatilis TaxID=10195 RepID=A0A3M7PCK8_BRAPC|nr:vacuolar sorting-associated 13D isoform X2 [Brachionus plicatilis]
MSQYHWSRADLDQLLSLRPNDAFGYNWCGGFKIDQIDAFYITCRHLNKNEFVYFKVEIFLDGGTFYIVFTDNLDYPFPVRIENMSQVPVQIYQPSTLEESNQILIKPKQNFNYCWDEHVGEHKLVIGVKGGTSALFDLSLSEEKKSLFYEDFFYVVFAKLDSQQAETDELRSEQELVLTCSGKRVYLDLKQTYNRNQLWSFSQEGHLVHVMSSPPKEMGALLDLATSYVLDIEEIAPRPQSFMSLSLSRPDPRRRNTQCWLFEPNGKLCCNVKNMCLQVIGDLKHKAEVVLGPGAKMSYQVVKEQLRPGSGQVSVSMSTDGPCRLIRISNVKDKSYLAINWEKLDESRAVQKSFELYVNLSGGIGLSVINWKQQEYEELLYAYFKSIELSFDQSQNEQKFILGIQSIQVCNQLVDASRQNLAYSIQTGAKHDLALKIDFLRKLRPDHSPIFIQHLIVNLLDLNVHLEEKLLWKLIQFLHATKQLPERVQNVSIESNSSYYRNQIGKLWRDSQTPRFSFAKLHISETRMSLSVYKTAKLSADLQTIKSDLGIPLVQFENAAIVCKPFMIINEHDTASCLIKLMSKHYGQELRSHAIRILGSVDFLGNPIGLVVDFKESLTNVISNGHVPDFVFSITHGVANSVSKFSGSLSDELNGLTMDENYQQVREQIRTLYSNGSMDHFVGGALGFAAGVFGGMISLGTQTYQGFSKDGIGGAVTGLMRGAVGTVSKPVVGVLDFATGIASAIKETSKTGSKMELPKIRESRCCSTSGGLLTLFSRFDANGQKILYQVNDLDLSEKFIAMEQIRSSDKTEQNIVRVIFC